MVDGTVFPEFLSIRFLIITLLKLQIIFYLKDFLGIRNLFWYSKANERVIRRKYCKQICCHKILFLIFCAH